jgi:hypothetical protein
MEILEESREEGKHDGGGDPLLPQNLHPMVGAHLSRWVNIWVGKPGGGWLLAPSGVPKVLVVLPVCLGVESREATPALRFCPQMAICLDPVILLPGFQFPIL